MKTQSNSIPNLIRHIQGGITISFNVEEKQRTEMNDAISTYYEYDCAKVSQEPSREEIIKSIIKCKYSLDDEFAVINNFADSPVMYNTQYLEYQSYRQLAKDLATQVLTTLI